MNELEHSSHSPLLHMPTSPGTRQLAVMRAHPCRSPPAAMLDPPGQVLSSAAGRSDGGGLMGKGAAAGGATACGGPSAAFSIANFIRLQTKMGYEIVFVYVLYEEVKLLEYLMFFNLLHTPKK